ncbi:InlB B-repeat-containing protein, partial [Holdemanella biformis]|uniref:InlB B-repeat-containing protein n=2 Tax=Holdemanella biformis TaxID=1735 RepID=UPI001C3844AD
MAIQFGMADTYYANTVSQEPEVEEQTLQEPITVEQTTTQEVNAEQTVQPVVDAIEKSAPVSEKKDVTLSYVAEDGTILSAATTHTYEIDYNLKSDASVMLNFDGYTLKDVVMNDSQIVTAAQANLNVTSDLYSVKFVYQKVNTEEKQEENVAQAQTKTEETNEEDEAEANPEAKEELPEYPAFDESATAGNVTVHAIAVEGVLPRGAKLVVKRVTRKAILNAVKETVSEKDKEVDSAIALDVTIVSKDGIEIQPNGVVNISFENAAISGNEVNIYHVSDDASTVTEVATNAQSFDANHFSIYVITGENEVPLTTFNFVANGNIVSTQTVKTGDTLITPTAPDMDGKAFVGWYDGETKFEDFNTALTITETTTREITAKYEDALYVYFYNPAGTQIMRTEKVSDHEAHDFTNISYEVDATHKIVGWAAKKNGTANIADSITVPTDKTSINVYAIIKEGYWISFDSDGGSIVDSQFVLHGDKLVLGKDTTPTKPGYTFAGWYNGLSKVENGATVTSPMTLKAHWNAAQVSYTVIHWWENADDDGYSFHESENKTGTTGKDANAKTKSYDGFTAQPVTKKTIKGDGSTIVSVYYKRNIYKVEFFEWYGWKQYEDLTITAKYGQDISKQWPTKNGSSTWGTTRNGGPYQVNIATMPLGGAKFYGPKTGNGSETAYYYVEVLPGEASDVTVSGIRYKLDHKDTSPGKGYYVTKEDQYPLTGYTFNENVSTKIRSKYNNAKFYYTRNSYKIKFINKGKEDKSVEKKYEQSISSENYTPVRPSSLPDYYEFDGWYDNELCEGEAFDFNGKKMPAQNVTLYAKWTAKKINLTYNLNNPEGDVVKGIKKVEAGTIANTVLPSATTTSDYSFAGWYYADGNGNITSDAYNTNEAITKDTSVIGKWLYNGELKVVYDPGTEGSKATVPTDSNIYAGGAKVTVAKNATTTSKKKFLGWKLNGNLYHPGDAFEVNKDLANNDNIITLKAIWGSEEFSTTMSYNPGNGRGSVQTVPVKNNESVTLKSEKDFGYQAPEAVGKEYYFAGWATSMDDANNGKATYAAGQSVHVDVDGENVLYATWIEKTVITLVANSNTVIYNGQSQEVNGFQSLTIDGYIVSGLNAHAQGTDVGTYPTEITGTAHVEKDNEDVTNKVVVKTTPGQLTITKKSIVPDDSNGIVVDGPKGSKYDGEKHENEPVVTDTKTGKTLVKGTDYTLTYSEDVINVGTVTVTITGTGNYEGTVDTSYEITPRKVIMTSADGSKVYDGSALTKNKVTESEDGFVKDDGATYNVTGSQTETGSSKNTFTYTLNEKTLEKNYVIETKEGTLEVTPVTDKVVVE